MIQTVRKISMVLALCLMVTLLFGSCTKVLEDGAVVKNGVVISSETVLPEIVEAVIHTELGDIKLKLYPDKAPLAVENFIVLARRGYYDGLTFHRTFDDFMIQSGDPKGDGTGGECMWGEAYTFADEIDPDQIMDSGKIAMANADYDLNTSQFFILQTMSVVTEEELKDAESKGFEVTEEIRKKYLNKQGAYWIDGWYTIFGEVTEGMNIVDKIAEQPLKDKEEGIPQNPVKIKTVEIITATL